MSSCRGSLSVVFLNISYVPSEPCCDKGMRFGYGLFCLYIFDISRWFGHVERKADDDWVKKCSKVEVVEKVQWCAKVLHRVNKISNFILFSF